MKQRSNYICQQCGYSAPQWLGKCPECGEWNSLVETAVSNQNIELRTKNLGAEAKPLKLSEIKTIKKTRVITGIGELDRVLGGGIVAGSVILVAGEPGIGKSTLMLQLAAKTGGLYVTGEESLQQVKLRAERLGMPAKGGSASGGKDNLYFLPQTDVDVISEAMVKSASLVPLAIVDSIQTLTTDELTGMAGSVGQVRECAGRLARSAKVSGLPVFLVGHVTKEGMIAGPKVLEHLVDTVIYIEGERLGTARLLRATKNRFGATDEVGVFEMTNKGLIEIDNPSRLFLKERVKKVPGSVVVSTIEGTRPVLVEIQALVVPTQLAIPRRVGQGVDYNRLQLITAVLTKRLKLPLGGFDIFVNITGGLKIEEPGIDLGIALAIFSSFKNIALDAKTVCWGELGLLGELREVSQSEKRAKEARRLGFTKIISPEKFSSINSAVSSLIHNR